MVHHDLHSEGFFTWLVGEDDHNSSLHVIQVDQVSWKRIHNFMLSKTLWQRFILLDGWVRKDHNSFLQVIQVDQVNVKRIHNFMLSKTL